MPNFVISDHLAEGIFNANIAEAGFFIAEDLSSAIDSELESMFQHIAYETGADIPEDIANSVFDAINHDQFRKLHYKLAIEAVDILNERIFDLFGTYSEEIIYVSLGDKKDIEPNDIFGFGRETISVRVELTRPDTVSEWLKNEGLDVDHDGHGISGFIRTADNETWAIHKLLGAIFEAQNWGIDIWQYLIFEAAMNVITSHLDYGETLSDWFSANVN